VLRDVWDRNGLKQERVGSVFSGFRSSGDRSFAAPIETKPHGIRKNDRQFADLQRHLLHSPAFRAPAGDFDDLVCDSEFVHLLKHVFRAESRKGNHKPPSAA